MSEATGIFVSGLHMRNGEDAGVFDDGMYFAADIIDAAIANGSWKRGSLRHIDTSPSWHSWPERWWMLKAAPEIDRP
jgi:hypothetical protein